MAFNGSSSNNGNSQNATTTLSTNIPSEVNNSNNLVPYTNPENSIQIQYPSDWKLVERGDNDFSYAQCYCRIFTSQSK